MESLKEEKIGFFGRLKKAIFELEDYGYFLGEKLTVAFKYFFLLVLLVSFIFTLAITYKFSNAINKIYSYIVNELPEFEYNDGALNFENYVEAYDHDYKFKLIINTSEEVTEEELKEYKNKVYTSGNYGMILLNTKAIIITESSEEETIYSEYLAVLEDTQNVEGIGKTTINIQNKQDLVSFLNEIGISNVVISLFIVGVIVFFCTNVFMILSDICIVAIFGWFASRICGVNFKMNPMIALSIYALSLSIVLDLIFDVIYIMTGFSVEYFNLIYYLIAYVYIIAAIFMIKYDLIKHTEELQKIVEVQKQVKKELDEEKENPDKDKEEKQKEDDEKKNEPEQEPEPELNREPDGSEI